MYIVENLPRQSSRINWTTGQELQLRGLGCAGGCGCGCKNESGGLGLFETGTDYTGWGVPEYLIVLGLGGYILTSMLFTGRSAVRAAGEGVRGRVRRGRQRLGKRIAGS